MIDDILMKHFVLPMFSLSYSSIKEEYINSYINDTGTYLFIEVKNPVIISNSVGSTTIAEKLFMLFEIDIELQEDMKLFIAGKYSKMSKKSVNKIIQLSGLKYNVPNGKDSTITSKYLAAFTRDKRYREVMEKELDVKLDEQELLDKLTKEVFIDSILT